VQGGTGGVRCKGIAQMRRWLTRLPPTQPPPRPRVAGYSGLLLAAAPTVLYENRPLTLTPHPHPPGRRLLGPAAIGPHRALRGHRLRRAGPHQVRAHLPRARRLWLLHPVLLRVSAGGPALRLRGPGRTARGAAARRRRLGALLQSPPLFCCLPQRPLPSARPQPPPQPRLLLRDPHPGAPASRGRRRLPPNPPPAPPPHPAPHPSLVFSYEILTPAALNFFVSYADGAVESLWSIDQYFQFVLVLMLSTGLSFQVCVWWGGGRLGRGGAVGTTGRCFQFVLALMLSTGLSFQVRRWDVWRRGWRFRGRRPRRRRATDCISFAQSPHPPHPTPPPPHTNPPPPPPPPPPRSPSSRLCSASWAC
jgi:hypothetical protein